MISFSYLCVIVSTLMILSLFLTLAWVLAVQDGKQHLCRLRIARIEHRWKLSLREAHIAIREETFGQVSRELHDNVCQMLAVTHSVLLGEVVPQSAGTLHKSGSWCAERIAASLETIRQLSHSLDKDLIRRQGLRRALEDQLTLTRRTSNLACSLDFPPEVPGLEAGTALALYRIIQECLHNTVRHAGASRVFICFGCPRPGLLEVTIADDGAGIPEGAVMRTAGMGLSGIRERVGRLHGNLEITTAAGEGFKLTITLNLSL